MWLVLAAIAFLAGQGYLFHCLGKLDRFLEQQPDGERDTVEGRNAE